MNEEKKCISYSISRQANNRALDRLLAVQVN